MKTRLEYRLVCHGAGQPGHHEHIFNYDTPEQVLVMKAKRDEEWRRKPATAVCTPFHPEVREISDWTTFEEDEDVENVEV